MKKATAISCVFLVLRSSRTDWGAFARPRDGEVSETVSAEGKRQP